MQLSRFRWFKQNQSAPLFFSPVLLLGIKMGTQFLESNLEPFIKHFNSW